MAMAVMWGITLTNAAADLVESAESFSSSAEAVVMETLETEAEVVLATGMMALAVKEEVLAPRELGETADGGCQVTINAAADQAKSSEGALSPKEVVPALWLRNEVAKTTIALSRDLEHFRVGLVLRT
jgi:hypothetical protein